MTIDDARRGAQTIALDDALDASSCGHKAATLAELKNAGYNVPDGFVIPVGAACSPEPLREALERLGPGPYAVRSSGVAEDLAEASFAGQYETVLGVNTLDEVVMAARRVRESGNSERVDTYRAEIDGNEAPLGVLVQRLINADAAGVMFTANPVTGDNEIVIEAVSGLGDKLMDGDVEGERWIVGKGGIQACGDTEVLDEAVVTQLVELARQLTRERGAPQDIEWALADGENYLLQVRPITGLPVRPQIEFPPGRWMKDTSHFAGPITPAGATILLPAYEAAFAHTFEEFGMPLDTILQRSFGGEVYTQEVDVGGKHDPSAPPPWWVLGIAVRLVPAMRRRMKAAEDAIPKLESYPRLWESAWRDECIERIEAARGIDLGAMSDEELLDELQRLIDDVLIPHLTLHFQMTIPHMVGVYELNDCCHELLGWDTARAMELLTGLSRATTAATRELRAVAALIDEATLAGPMGAVRTSEAGPALEAWLQHWGLRTIDVDPGAPMTAECDALVLNLLRQARTVSDDDAALEQKRQDAIAEARERLSGTARQRFEGALAYAERVYPQRDDNVPYTEGLPCGLIRRTLLAIGSRLSQRGALHAAGDVSYLHKDELAPALNGTLDGETAAERASRRRAEHAWMLAHPGPLVVGPAPVPDPDLRGLPAAARRIMTGVLWAAAEELTPAESKQDEDGNLLGIGVSPGSYTGPVRVIKTEAELDRLQPGDVLVCPTTHSSWTVVFGQAGALVTDGGGMLSHPSIIAREHGIPAVVATGCATSRLRDGQTVTVDGITGRVQIH
jgi:pyruvate,water dikinase